MRVGIREMKNRFSRYLKLVKQGETLIITERNNPVARLVPIQAQTSAEILNLVNSGIVSWKGGKPQGLAEPPKIEGTKTLSDLVSEDRR